MIVPLVGLLVGAVFWTLALQIFARSLSRRILEGSAVRTADSAVRTATSSPSEGGGTE